MKFICSKQTLYDAIVNVSKAVSERAPDEELSAACPPPQPVSRAAVHISEIILFFRDRAVIFISGSEYHPFLRINFILLH